MALHDLDLLQVTDTGLAYIVLGGFVVVFSLVSLLVKEKLYINEVVLGTAFGVIIGPYCAGIFDPRSWLADSNAVTLEVMRVVLATGLFAIGVELPQSYMADHAKGLFAMVVPTMAFGWIIVAAIIYGIFPPINFISSLVIAACLTPTDPIICAAIVGGKFAKKHVPQNLRRILSAESAANDGMAYPFLSISIYLTVDISTRDAIGKWFLVGWLYEVILGVVLGAVLGLFFNYLMKISLRNGFIDRESYVAQYLALALFTIGIASTIGSDDLLAAFAAGTAISWDGHFNDQTDNEVFSSVIDLILNCGCFVYIGAWLPFDSFNMPELSIVPWRLVVVFLLIIFLRRIPALLVLYYWVPEIETWREALFSGHFGPMGVGAIFISTLALTRLPTPHSPPVDQVELLAATLQPIVSFIVLGSIIIHGLSIPFFSFSRQVHSRTVSLSRTWTSPTATGHDWLLWARRAPGHEVTVAATIPPQDLQRAQGDEDDTVAIQNSEGSRAIASQVTTLNESTTADSPMLEQVSVIGSPRRSLQSILPSIGPGTQSVDRASLHSRFSTTKSTESISGRRTQRAVRFPTERHPNPAVFTTSVESDGEDTGPSSGPHSPVIGTFLPSPETQGAEATNARREDVPAGAEPYEGQPLVKTVHVPSTQ
ncbi:Sodium/hydrogen exchanger family-domain-containing protein [Amylocystis lapponica]|nr:Sodium/hydrogen exchanger family-domain-containing protein [Amylocystis lapponica]